MQSEPGRTLRRWAYAAVAWLVVCFVWHGVPLWIGCAVLTMRGVPGLVENVTTATGLTPHGLLGMEKEAVDTGSRDFWKTMVINGYFFLGAVLLVPATVLSRRSRRQARVRCGVDAARPAKARS
ncbi:hypothetical protein ABVB69_35695 [Streptomyces sp. NPDC000349]|uniref:hypothetical protein n=1 Tax=unclassified Streptomyces TaxID=2593676 RepID=UPI00278A4252|nr:hypothetical protein [Streptomyces sp. DSM 40167]MDQ0408531.1 hypothetical protein [Streptomyces sp. DSM 40167]